MKKIVNIILYVALGLSLSVSAYAEGSNQEEESFYGLIPSDYYNEVLDRSE